MGLNQFSDMTQDEFENIMLNLPPAETITDFLEEAETPILNDKLMQSEID